jgi:hypothetical protein
MDALPSVRWRTRRASQIASAPSPQPTSSARPRVRPATSATSRPFGRPLHIAPSRSLYLASHSTAFAAAPNRCSPCSCMLLTMAPGGATRVPYRRVPACWAKATRPANAVAISPSGNRHHPQRSFARFLRLHERNALRRSPQNQTRLALLRPTGTQSQQCAPAPNHLRGRVSLHRGRETDHCDARRSDRTTRCTTLRAQDRFVSHPPPRMPPCDPHCPFGSPLRTPTCRSALPDRPTGCAFCCAFCTAITNRDRQLCSSSALRERDRPRG